eukprot:12221698-Alexandrium_andersonii.AAC.2
MDLNTRGSGLRVHRTCEESLEHGRFLNRRSGHESEHGAGPCAVQGRTAAFGVTHSSLTPGR